MIVGTNCYFLYSRVVDRRANYRIPTLIQNSYCGRVNFLCSCLFRSKSKEEKNNSDRRIGIVARHTRFLFIIIRRCSVLLLTKWWFNRIYTCVANANCSCFRFYLLLFFFYFGCWADLRARVDVSWHGRCLSSGVS